MDIVLDLKMEKEVDKIFPYVKACPEGTKLNGWENFWGHRVGGSRPKGVEGSL